MTKIKTLFILGTLFSLATSIWADTTTPPTRETQTHFDMRYLVGHGVPLDATYAFNELLAAAKQNDPLAQNEVAYLFLAGKGTPENAQKAFEYYQKAADQKLSSAQYNLGLLYQYGVGHAPDHSQACAWLTEAAHAGFEPAKQALSQYCV